MINTIERPENFQTDGSIWWLIYDSTNSNIVVEPNQCSGLTSSPFTMVTSDSLDELLQYISDNGLIITPEDSLITVSE